MATDHPNRIRRRAIGRAATIGAALLLASTSAHAAPNISGDVEGPILFTADNLTHLREDGTIIAEGKVEVSYGDEMLYADRLTYNRTADRVTAEGNVILVQKSGDVLFAESVELTSDFREGIARHIKLRTVDNARAAAVEAVRKDGRTTTLRQAVYTPCKSCADNPDAPVTWQLKAGEITHDEETRRVEYSDARLEILGVPVLYTPYLSHPDPRDKKGSGFLVPESGNNSDLGWYTRTPYFWNIAPERDLTIDPIIYVDRPQLVLGGEYRQAFDSGYINIGGSGTYITEDNKIGGTTPGKAEFRGHIDATGRFNIDDTWRWGFDMNRASDDTYIRRYGFGNERTLTSRGFVEGFRQQNYAIAEAYSFQNQRVDRNDALTPDLVTNMAYTHAGEMDRFGGYWTVDTSLLSVSRSDGQDTRRVYGDVGWHLPYVSPYGEIYEFSAGLAGAGYHYSELINPITSSRVNDIAGRAFPRMTMSWSLPVYRTHATVTEVIEPTIRGVLSPNPGSDWRVPNEDSQGLDFSEDNLFEDNRYPGIDRFDGGQRIDYGLRWSAHGSQGGATEVFLGQSYRYKKTKSLNAATGLADNFSDIVGSIRVTPNEFLNLDYRYRLDKENFSIRKSLLRLNGGPRSAKISLEHSFIDAAANTLLTGERNEIYGRLDARLTENWFVTAFERHRLNKPAGLMRVGGGVTYQDDCLKVSIEFARDEYADRDLKPDTSVYFRFSLKNFGGFED